MRLFSREALLRSTALIALLAIGLDANAQAPQGGTVVSGDATITRQGSTTVIRQESGRGVIDWRSFSIGSDEAVRFDQPNRSSVTLNRVTGAEISRIDGRLSANGQVWLANPNGVFIGQRGQVDVAGLLATTGRIDAGEFLRTGQARIDRIARDASIVNMGKVTVSLGGYAALAGALLRNEGMIAAQAGTVALAAGEAVAIDFAGDSLLRFQVSQPLSQASTGADALISGGGQILAEGGAVRLTARAAKGVIDNVINLKGKVIASEVRIDGGVVTLGDGGIAQTSALIDARSETGVGGQVEILGEKVGVMQGASIDASGAQGGGSILIGGDWRGGGEGRNARAAYVDPGATIRADALNLGDGGKVVIWSDDTTRFGGLISAQGGLAGGSGGKVETSGRLTLIVDPAASVTTAARAAGAAAGGWLLDPTDIRISKTGSASLTEMDGALRFASGGSSEIAASTISAGLARGDVTIQTSANGPGFGRITFASGTIAYAGAQARSLKLLADREIKMDKDAAIHLSGAAHNVTLNAWANATKQSEMLGGILVDGKISTTSGGISLVAGKDGALMASSGGVSGHGVFIASNAVLRSESGEITMAGWRNPRGGNDGVKVRGLIETKSGAIRLIGDGGGNSIGLYFLGGAVRSESGEITVRSNNFVFGGGAVENRTGVIRVESLNASDAIDVFGRTRRTATQLNVSADQIRKLAGAVVIGRSDQTGTITVNSGAILSKDLTLQTGSGAINFLGAVDGPASLTLRTGGGSAAFLGAIGQTTPLARLIHEGSGDVLLADSVRSAGEQRFEGSVKLQRSTVFSSRDGDISFRKGLNAFSTLVPTDLTFAAGAGAIRVDGAIGAELAFGKVTKTGSGTMFLNGGVTSTGAQSYAGAIQLTGDAAFNVVAKPTVVRPEFMAVAAGRTLVERGLREGADAGLDQTISFGGAIDGAYGLTVSARDIIFGGAIGASAPLQLLTINAGGSSLVLPSLAANIVSLSVAPGGVVTQTGALDVNGLELVGPFASFALTDAGNAIRLLAANGRSVVVTNGPLTNLTVGSVGGTTGVYAADAVSLSQLPANALILDAPITGGGLVSLSSSVINGQGLISAGSLSVSAESGSIRVSPFTPFSLSGGSIMVSGGFSQTTWLTPTVEAPRTTLVTTTPPQTTDSPTVAAPTPPRTTVAAVQPTASALTSLASNSLDALSTPALAAVYEAVASQVVAVVQSAKESVRRTESLATLQSDLLSTDWAAPNAGSIEPFATATTAPVSARASASSDWLEALEEKDAAASATIARILPSLAPFVPETGARVAASPTREVDPIDSAGKGGQVISSTTDLRAAAEEKETVIPGLLSRKAASSQPRAFKEDILDLLMPEINDEGFLY